jgi:hypothetical protein
MAQMPRDEAAILNDRLQRKFSVVLAQADSRFSTAVQEVSYGAGHRPVVLTPSELMDSDAKAPQVGVATLSCLTTGKVTLKTRANRGDPIPGAPEATGSSFPGLVASAWSLATKTQVSPSADRAALFRTVTLHALRDTWHADVALTQDRDFYHPEADRAPAKGQPPVPANVQVQAAVEQIVWKGDFAIVQTITGAALKAALAESARLKALDEDYVPQMESGRWLRHLGLMQDPTSKTWYVNGAAIDDKASYSVAMSDFLASGDTGYPTLKDPAVPPGPRPAEIRKLLRISEAVVDKLTGNGSAQVEAYTYLDHSQGFPAATGRSPEPNARHRPRAVPKAAGSEIGGRPPWADPALLAPVRRQR